MVAIINRKLFIVVVLTCLFGCTSPEYDKAMLEYEKASAAGDLPLIIENLKILDSLKSPVHLSELLQAENAQQLLVKAQQYALQRNKLKTYQLAHDSYRTYSSHEAKLLVAKSGKKFIALLKVQSNIEQAYQFLPSDLMNTIQKYTKQPLEQWDIVKLNILLEQLTQSANKMGSAVTLFNASQAKSTHPDLLSWFEYIKEQHQFILQTRQHFMTLAFQQSGKVLLEQNELLTKNAQELLAYVRADMAMNPMQPLFNKAMQKYFNYGDLIDNVYISVKKHNQNEDLTWYKHWKALETSVLTLDDTFINYVPMSVQRSQAIKAFMLSDNAEVFVSKLNDKDTYTANNEFITQLLAKLKRDKRIVN